MVENNDYIDDWPHIEVEKKFDWSLSMKDIERIYKPNGTVNNNERIRRHKEVQSRWPIDTEPYIKVSKKIERVRQELGWPEKPKPSHEDFLKRIESEPEPNFHEPESYFQQKLSMHKLLCSGRQ